MSLTIDYYLGVQSPWTYLGHQRFADMAREAGATVRVLPTDFGKVFPVSGGLPLGQRAPQRQAYRLVDMRRTADHLNIPINLKPVFFPVNGDAASRLIIVVNQQDGTDAAMKLCDAVYKAVWLQQRNIADEAVLDALLAERGLNAARLAAAREPAAQAQYEANSQAAIEQGVFGAPSYVVDGEIFWGQDRLDFLQRKLRG